MGEPRKLRGAKAKPADPAATVVTLPEVKSDDPREVEELCAKCFPDWPKLDAREKAELVRLLIARSKRDEPLEVKLTPAPGGGNQLDFGGTSKTLTWLKLENAIASQSLHSANARANEIMRYLESVGRGNESGYNAVLAFLEGMAPESESEALLLIQTYATHDAAIKFLIIETSSCHLVWRPRRPFPKPTSPPSDEDRWFCRPTCTANRARRF